MTKLDDWCWACSIPKDVWLKLALLNVTVSYNVQDRAVVLLQPALLAANKARQAVNTHRVVLRHPGIKHTWNVNPHRATVRDWEDICSAIAEAVHAYHWAGGNP
jgi:hypothetical protein